MLVIGSVVVVQEAVRVDVLALVGIQVELAQPVVVDLFQQLPVGADVDGRVAVALRLVVVLPAEAAAPTSATASIPATTATIVATALPACAVEGGTAPAAVICASATTLATATTSEDSTAAEARLAGVADVGDDGEGGLVLFDGGRSKDGGACGTVRLLVCVERS